MKAKIRKHLNLGLLAIATAMMACQNIVDKMDAQGVHPLVDCCTICTAYN